LVLMVVGSVLVTGCGSSGRGSSVKGVYKAKNGDQTAVITLEADGNGEWSVGTSTADLVYKVKGDTVVLKDPKDGSSNSFTIVKGGLRESESGLLYKKQ